MSPEPIAPLCSVARGRLVAQAERRKEEIEEVRQQQRFERICARELLGEID